MFSVNFSVLWLVSNVSKFIFNNTCPVVVDKIMGTYAESGPTQFDHFSNYF